MLFTYYGHSCFSVFVAGKHLLFDPFITGNPLAKDIDINSLPADYILLSHGHGDHICDSVAIAKRTGATIIAAYEVANWMQQQGCEKAHGMNYGSFMFEFGKVKFVPAWHSSVMPDGAYGGNPGGFVVQTEEGDFYYAGDTCLLTDMQLIPRYANVKFAVLPIGGNFTMDVEEAVIAAEFVQCDKIVGAHYDTFGVIKVDHAQAKAAFAAKGKELILAGIGEQIEM
jgi:L-ascorbate metabolism protein UlaG (beta-lactamase superfamily)